MTKIQPETVSLPTARWGLIWNQRVIRESKTLRVQPRRLDELRRNWLNPEGASEAELKKRTLTNLYNARPTWLENAHERLDAAVFAAYGWSPDITDEEVLQNLLALNLERSKPGQ